MPNSQNGWPVVGQAAVTDRAIHGVEFPNGWLKGDVDTVFTYLIERLHTEVEPLDKGGCWGWFVKTIEGSETISNHASGTAIDYNAPAHPMGRRNTYSEAKQDRVREILDDLDGVVRWGGDYTGRPDDMHFEINRGAAAVRAVATKIRAGELPMALTQADFKRLEAMVTRVVDARADQLEQTLRAEINAVPGELLDAVTRDPSNTKRTVRNHLVDLSQLRDFMVGADNAIKGAVPAAAPVARMAAAADQVLTEEQTA